MKIKNRSELISIIRQQDWLMEALRDVRSLELPDWYIAAGAVRNTVWNYLHSFPTTFNQNDVDVIYFDQSDMNGEREGISEKSLKEKNPKLKWEVVNQARVHLFNNRPNIGHPPVKSSGKSIAYWSETPTCVGIRLEASDAITICAPYGLNDLMDLIVKPIPKPYQNLVLYQQRVKSKNWAECWPNLKIIH